MEILALLGGSGPLNRSQIADRLGLGPATVTEHTRRLVAGGYLRELPPESGGVGRPRVPLQMLPDAAYAIGLYLMPTSVIRVLVGLDGRVVRGDTVPFDPGAHPVGQLTRLATELLTDPDVGPRCRAVGVAVPGLCDPETGSVHRSYLLNWTELPLGELLGVELAVPVLVESDLRAGTGAELLFGTGRQDDDFLVLELGEYIGLGVVLNRRVRRGPGGLGGAFGHTPAVPGGARCDCGSRGCLRTVLGVSSVLAAARQRGLLPEPGPADAADLAALAGGGAGAGVVGLRDMLAGLGGVLGRALSGVVNLLAVRSLTVVGTGQPLWPYLAPGFDAATGTAVLAPLRPLRLTIRPFQPDWAARGAATLAMVAADVLG